jgi:hypothetical protein
MPQVTVGQKRLAALLRERFSAPLQKQHRKSVDS